MASPLLKAVQQAPRQPNDLEMLTPKALINTARLIVKDDIVWGFATNSGLTLAEATAIRLYGREAYEDVNPWFWLPDEGRSSRSPRTLKRCATPLNRACPSSPTSLSGMEGKCTVHRGAGFWPAGLKEGDRYQDQGFLSTSAKKTVVDTRFDKKYRIEIALTKEVGARSVEELTGNKREKRGLDPDPRVLRGGEVRRSGRCGQHQARSSRADGRPASGHRIFCPGCGQAPIVRNGYDASDETARPRALRPAQFVAGRR